MFESSSQLGTALGRLRQALPRISGEHIPVPETSLMSRSSLMPRLMRKVMRPWQILKLHIPPQHTANSRPVVLDGSSSPASADIVMLLVMIPHTTCIHVHPATSSSSHISSRPRFIVAERDMLDDSVRSRTERSWGYRHSLATGGKDAFYSSDGVRFRARSSP
jgi:hypothetical protein